MLVSRRYVLLILLDYSFYFVLGFIFGMACG